MEDKKSKGSRAAKKSGDNLTGEIVKERLQGYIKKCSDEESVPNIAGFAVFCGIGTLRLKKILKGFPEDWDIICSYFEDMALNSEAPPSLLTPYMKKYFGYGEKAQFIEEEDGDTFKIVVEHDILKDGE